MTTGDPTKRGYGLIGDDKTAEDHAADIVAELDCEDMTLAFKRIAAALSEYEQRIEALESWKQTADYAIFKLSGQAQAGRQQQPPPHAHTRYGDETPETHYTQQAAQPLGDGVGRRLLPVTYDQFRCIMDRTITFAEDEPHPRWNDLKSEQPPSSTQAAQPSDAIKGPEYCRSCHNDTYILRWTSDGSAIVRCAKCNRIAGPEQPPAASHGPQHDIDVVCYDCGISLEVLSDQIDYDSDGPVRVILVGIHECSQGQPAASDRKWGQDWPYSECPAYIGDAICGMGPEQEPQRDCETCALVQKSGDPAEADPQHPRTATQTANNECSVCHERYATSGLLYEHMAKKHPITLARLTEHKKDTGQAADQQTTDNGGDA